MNGAQRLDECPAVRWLATNALPALVVRPRSARPPAADLHVSLGRLTASAVAYDSRRQLRLSAVHAKPGPATALSFLNQLASAVLPQIHRTRPTSSRHWSASASISHHPPGAVAKVLPPRAIDGKFRPSSVVRSSATLVGGSSAGALLAQLDGKKVVHKTHAQVADSKVQECLTAKLRPI